MNFGSVVLGCLVAFVTGCSTSYMPKTSPRVAIIQQAGTPAYVRDGRVYEGGLFGGDLLEAVRGNPEAEAHARAYKSGMVGGFVTSVLGAAGMGVGLATFVRSGAANDTGGERSATNQTVSVGLLAGGAVAYITGLVLLLNAQPHMWDAINVYNDGLLPRPLLPPAPGPRIYPPPSPETSKAP